MTQTASLFVPNYPFYEVGEYRLLSTPERTGALDRYTGRGVVMAFIDSGFYPHPDLGNRVLAHIDATSSRILDGRRFSIHESRPVSWHGQMTSVIAAGDGATSGGKYRGIASGAELVLIKVSNHRQQIREPDILRGMRWLIENHRHFNIRLLNMSVGGDHPSDDPDHPVYRAVRTLTEFGIVVLAAAGNTGQPVIVPPASAPDAIMVGGINDQNSLNEALWLPYSNNFGVAYDGTRKPDVTAPAAWIASPLLPGSLVARQARWLAPMLQARDERTVRHLLRQGYADLDLSWLDAQHLDRGLRDWLQDRIHHHKLIDPYHQHVDGTSVSVAIASSIVAQMLEANARLTPARIKAILTSTAQQLPNVPTERQGAGVINAACAVMAAAASTI